MRQIKIIVVASHYPAWAVQAEDFYKKQIRGFCIKVEQIRLSTSIEKESLAILSKLPKNYRLILLDVVGAGFSSDNFATQLEQWLTDTLIPVFVVGGPQGVGENLKKAAHNTISLSKMTLPHAIARLMLVEQLFRADCVFRRHPYPR